MWILFAVILVTFDLSNGQSYELYGGSQSFAMQKEILMFLKDYDREASEMCNRVANAEWRFATNATDYNKRRMQEQQSVATKFECLSWRRAHSINGTVELDETLKRQFDRILNHGHCALADAKFQELNHVITQMKDNYNNVRICPYMANNTNTMMSNTTTDYLKVANYLKSSPMSCGLKLDPDINRVMQRSRSEPELRYAWTAWRDKTGAPIRNTFMRYIDLANQAAKLHGFSDTGEQMRSLYEDKDFYFTVQDLWKRIQPLYKQLFTLVRRGLIRQYGENIIRSDGPVPAHLLGNMWAQNWKNIIDLVKPGPLETPDLTGELAKQGYSPLRIFQAAEEFFTSIGMPPMTPEFWRNSMLQRPADSFMQCAASAWDFCNNADFRIKQCTQVTIEDYISSFHEMTHIQYFMQYAVQPFVFREGPNAAFHEAIAHAIGLSVAGPVHLQKVGLLSQSVDVQNPNSAVNIEFLLGLALEKLPFMAYSLALEKWRWHVFENGPIGMNSQWWELRLNYQGVIPPVMRTNEHFDPGAKYHVVSDQDYVKYFIATVQQFQMFSDLCRATNHVGPLHTCDIYRSREAGRILTEFMQKGASASPDQLLKIISRGKTTKISADAILEYFRPLEDWLREQNRNESVIGWNSNMQDVALYQLLQSSALTTWSYASNFLIISIVYTLLKLF